MRRALTLLAGLTFAAAGCNTSQRERESDEVEVTFDQVPPAVRETLSRESGGDPVGKIVVEREKGKAVYEAMITKAGKTWEIDIDEAGNVVEREQVKARGRGDR